MQREKSPLPLRQDPQLEKLFRQAGGVILGKPRVLRLAMTCLLARGHLLIEDLPGMGKTTLAHLLATLLGLDYQRIQFTSDLLPADIVGVSIYDRASERFHFHPAPSSPSWSWPTRSTAPRPRPRAPSSRPWRNCR